MSRRIGALLSRWARRHPVRLAFGATIALIGVGTLLLLLPVARTHRAGQPTGGLQTAVFSATSAVCGSGLSVVDIGAYWSGFGQVVLLLLMQLGGLGMMVGATLLALLVASRLGLTTKLLAGSPTGALDLATVRRVVRGTLLLAGVLEGLVTVALALRLWLGHGYPIGRALWFGLFHAVSGFTNTGLTLWPDSLRSLGADGWLLTALAAAFLIGGLGYPTVHQLVTTRSIRQWSLHAQLTVAGAVLLGVAGAVLVPVIERLNPATLGAGPTAHRLGAAVFAGLTPRSAGFDTLDHAAAEPSTRLVTDLLMLIGGGSGSTAGGIKITTVAVLALAVLAEVRGTPDVEVLGRRIGSGTVRQAIAVTGLSLAVVLTGVLALFTATRADLDTVLFEAISAFSGSGLTTGLTASLGTGGRWVIVLLMLVGRVGPITLATGLALRQTRHAFRYPEVRPVIG